MRWISVNEKLPEHGQYVLICCSKNVEDQIYFFDSKRGFVDPLGDTGYSNDATHWMALPEPPKDQK
jgi:hypothetical protein